ncbi:DNRLRE domain-containing protein [Dyadobacter sp. CY261]|uniref:DNRLRE domain-containing protein n=1 Tax=Dyadobacter sp. CY261 TaxID=2907203 RepID=UPI001F481C27|nr:DNRLRE domain-containing protein [Dyadobacter sp. CY261]MCF0075672.1 DNRLRE domain-containing protein [Dyadobacter sp. CY261]
MKHFAKFSCLFLFLIAYSNTSIGQITYSMKPDACRGIDARVITIGGLTAPGNTNYGNFGYFVASTWTYGDIGGGTGVTRSYIEFTDLRNVPQGAVISSATLYLYGPTSDPIAPSGNTGDAAYLQRVTSSWGESSITGNTQPSFTTTNQVTVPGNTSYSNVTLNVTSLVQDVVNLPAAQRYGFRMQLQSETTYKWLSFASSDYPDASRRPRLDVTFTFCPSALRSTENQTPSGSDDYPADKISSDRLKEFQDDSFPLTVSPNPAQAVLNIDFELPGVADAKVTILSQSSGKVLKIVPISKGDRKRHLEVPIDPAFKSESAILLRIEQGGATSIRKVVIVK